MPLNLSLQTRFPWIKVVAAAAMFILMPTLLAAQDIDRKTDEELLETGQNPESDDTEAELARAAQNPVAAMISLPFQNNMNFNVGPQDGIQNILNIQPVIPFSLTPKLNLITRTIVPVLSQPEFIPEQGRTSGLSDTVFTAFFSPAKPKRFIWGVGPAFLLPTATDQFLGTEKWGIGPSAVILDMHGPWVYGTLVNNLWSFAGDESRGDVNSLTIQYFINYNLPDGWYLSSSPIITSNWEADSGNKWTLPFGGGFGKIARFGRQPVNLSAQAYYNAKRPEFGGDWQLRLVATFLFPK